MTRDEYIKAILKKARLDGQTRKRLEADLTGDVDARLEAGESMEQVVGAMGAPEQVAAQLRQSMGGAAVRKNPWRWVFLGFAILLVVAILVTSLFWILAGTGRIPAPQKPSNIGVIGGADGPTAIYVTSTSRGFATTYMENLGLALGAFGVFLLMQWKGVTKAGRFLALGLAGVLFAAVLLAGGLSGSMLESVLPFHSLGYIMASRLIHPAFWAPLIMGIAALRRWARLRKVAPEPPQ